MLLGSRGCPAAMWRLRWGDGASAESKCREPRGLALAQASGAEEIGLEGTRVGWQPGEGSIWHPSPVSLSGNITMSCPLPGAHTLGPVPLVPLQPWAETGALVGGDLASSLAGRDLGGLPWCQWAVLTCVAPWFLTLC